MIDVWPAVHLERHALIADLAALTPQQWDTPSLAAGWSVHDVAAHLVDGAATTPWRLLRAMVAARMDFDRQNAAGIAAARGATPGETLAALRAVADRTSGPPTMLVAVESRLVEEIAHGEDIRRPLGITRRYPIESLVAALRYQVTTSEALGGARSLARRTTLVADDAELRIGKGPQLRGPALSLLLVATGRHHALVELSGPGVARVPTQGPGHASVGNVHGVRRRAVTALNRAAGPIISRPALMRLVGIEVCQVRYVGRRSHTPVHLTAWWHARPGGGWIEVGTAQYKTWWRNFRGDGQPIEVAVRGTSRSGTARAVEDPSGAVRVEVTFEA